MSDVGGKPLPKGWCKAAIRQVLKFNYGKSLSGEFRKIGDIPVYGSSGRVGSHDLALANGPAIIVGRKGSVGIVHFVQGHFWAIDTTYFISDFVGVVPRFAFYQLEFMRLAQVEKSTAIPGISREDIYERIIALCPLNEQTCIANRLDELLSDLDAGVAALERAKAKLKHYRSAVLKAAVEGALTAEWRKKHPATEPASVLLTRILTERRRRWEEAQLKKFKDADKEPPKDWKTKYKEPVAPDTTDLPVLPFGWCWVSIDQLCSEVRNGYSSKPDAETGVPILRISSVRPLALSFEDMRYLTGCSEDYANHLIKAADLLFTRYNGTPSLVGVCALVPKIDRDIVHPDKLIRCRMLLNGLGSPNFVAIASNVGSSRRFLAKRIRTTAGQAGVSGSDIKEIPIPFPPAFEQDEVAELIEDQLSVIDHLEADLEAKLKSAQALRQSILRHAFTGQLVPQDPNDEPASALLQRIAAEREERARLLQATKKAKPKTPRRTIQKSRKKKAHD